MAIVHPRTLTAGTPRTGASPARAAPVDEESFCQDVSLMLQSGLTLLEALKTLKERTPSRRAAPVERLLRRLEEGESLSQAMQGVGGFRAALTATVRSSELTGDLADSLHRYGQNASRLRTMRSRLVSALVYPVLLIAVAALGREESRGGHWRTDFPAAAAEARHSTLDLATAERSAVALGAARPALRRAV